MNLKSMKDKLEHFLKSKGFSVGKTEQIVKECLEKLEQLDSGTGPDDTLVRTIVHDVLTKSTAQSSGSSASAGDTPSHSLADEALAVLKDATTHA